MANLKFKKSKTARGFKLKSFKDRYGVKCSIQKSSLATEDAIWLGVDDVNPLVLHSDAKMLGLNSKATCGWVGYPIPECVNLSSRMHLTKDQVADLIPVLQKFVDTGEV